MEERAKTAGDVFAELGEGYLDCLEGMRREYVLGRKLWYCMIIPPVIIPLSSFIARNGKCLEQSWKYLLGIGLLLGLVVFVEAIARHARRSQTRHELHRKMAVTIAERLEKTSAEMARITEMNESFYSGMFRYEADCSLLRVICYVHIVVSAAAFAVIEHGVPFLVAVLGVGVGVAGVHMCLLRRKVKNK